MDLERVPIGSFEKTIINYSKRVKRGRITWLDEFPVGKSRWKMGIAPGGANGNHDSLWLYLAVADGDRLPQRWYREAYLRLGLRNQAGRPMIFFLEWKIFTESVSQYGRTLVTLSELHGHHVGYLYNNTIQVEATVLVTRAFPMAIDETCIGVNKFRQSTAGFGRFLEVVEPSSVKEKRTHDETPSLQEVEEAKRSLKECLSGLYKLDFHDKLMAALSTLSSAKVGLSAEQHDCMQKLQGKFPDFVTDYLFFEARNSNYELEKLGRAKIVSSLKCFRNKQIEYNKKMDDLMREGEQLQEQIKVCQEEEEVKLRFEQVEDEKMKLVLLMENVVADAKEMMSDYDDKEKKFAKAKELKRQADEWLSRSSTTWSCLKLHFG